MSIPYTTTLSWSDAVRRVSELAHSKLPEAMHGAIERATALVLAGHVCLEEDGKHAHVRSSDGSTWYLVNGHCTCMGATHAPEGYCKHRLAKMLYQRAGDLQRQGLPPAAAGEVLTGPAGRPAPAGADAPCPEAPFSATFRGHIGGVETLLTARGCTFEQFAANVQAVRALLDSTPPAATTPATVPSPEGWCLIHNTQMARQSNDRGHWWSHKTADGWCRGKARPQA
jgi:hypothetical protein